MSRTFKKPQAGNQQAAGQPPCDYLASPLILQVGVEVIPNGGRCQGPWYERKIAKAAATTACDSLATKQ